MDSLILVMALLSTVLASPVLRSRVIEAQSNAVDLGGNMFDELTNLASANVDGASWTDSVVTTLDLQGYPASTGLKPANEGVRPTNLDHNIYLGAPEQQGEVVADADIIKEGLNRTPENPCPRLHTLCTQKYQYFPLAYVNAAYPCSSPSAFHCMTVVDMFMADVCGRTR